MISVVLDHFPDLEVLNDDTNAISSLDYMYIVSTLLYFACVRQTNVFFQRVCSHLDPKKQASIARFFSSVIPDHDKFLRKSSSIVVWCMFFIFTATAVDSVGVVGWSRDVDSSDRLQASPGEVMK